MSATGTFVPDVILRTIFLGGAQENVRIKFCSNFAVMRDDLGKQYLNGTLGQNLVNTA